MYDMGKEVSKLERKADSLIKSENALTENLNGKKPRKKNKEALKELQPKTTEAILRSDFHIIHMA